MRAQLAPYRLALTFIQEKRWIDLAEKYKHIGDVNAHGDLFRVLEVQAGGERRERAVALAIMARNELMPLEGELSVARSMVRDAIKVPAPRPEMIQLVGMSLDAFKGKATEATPRFMEWLIYKIEDAEEVVWAPRSDDREKRVPLPLSLPVIAATLDELVERQFAFTLHEFFETAKKKRRDFMEVGYQLKAMCEGIQAAELVLYEADEEREEPQDERDATPPESGTGTSEPSTDPDDDLDDIPF